MEIGTIKSPTNTSLFSNILNEIETQLGSRRNYFVAETLAQELELERKARQQNTERDKSPLQG